MLESRLRHELHIPEERIAEFRRFVFD